VRVSALDDDLEDAYAEGIIMTGAAGNGRWKHETPGGADWNNTFEMATRYPGSVDQPYYYMRGTSPTANDNTTVGTHNLPAICVGAVDITSTEQKVTFSDCGAGVDLFAPGTSIMSALTSGVNDPRNASFFIGKFSGTSMASPQVCGVLACALETYPTMNQTQAKAYITGIAKTAQLTGSNGGPTDGQDLQGAPNLYLFYRIERKISGTTFPKINNRQKPTAGAAFPRTKIRRTT
jgi:subtilisin family serine protease